MISIVVITIIITTTIIAKFTSSTTTPAIFAIATATINSFYYFLSVWVHLKKLVL